MDARRRSHRTIEITVLSAENLCMNRKPVRKNAFVVVQAQPSSSATKCCTTRMAAEGGSYPSWNEKFLVEVPVHAGSITLEVQCKTWLGVRSVGAAQIAVSDFFGGGVVPETWLQFLSYMLWDRRGRRNGIINFSVRVKAPPAEEASGSTTQQIAATGTTMAARGTNSRGFEMAEAIGDQRDSDGVVTGIPVSWNYPTTNNIPRPF